MTITSRPLFLLLVITLSVGALRLPSQTNLIAEKNTKTIEYDEIDGACGNAPYTTGSPYGDETQQNCQLQCNNLGDSCLYMVIMTGQGSTWCTFYDTCQLMPSVQGFQLFEKVDSDPSSATGDPHMINLKKEKFDVLREGLADLMVIANGTHVLLKIQGMIKRTIPSCKRFVCNFGLFITEVTLSGSWVKRKFEFGIEKTQNKKELSVLIDGTEAWPLSKEDSIFSELPMRVSNFSLSDQGLRFDFMDTTLDIRRVIQNYTACMRDNESKFFNIHFRGSSKLLRKGMTIGGILGNDPHEDWEKCDISDDKSMLFQDSGKEMKMTNFGIYATAS